MARKAYSNSFAGGEMSSLMLGHIEDQGYRTGYARGRNLVVLPTGALTRRPEFAFCKAAKAGTTPRLFPFRYGDGDSYAMEWGPTHTRFHTEGQTLKYATPIPVASVDLGTDTFTTTAPHGLAINEQVRITHKGTSIPGNLATGTVYYVRDIPTSTTFTLSASGGPGALLDLTTNSAIDETSFWRQSELPREYVQSRNVTRNGNNLDAAAAHGLVNGDLIRLATTGTLPPPLATGTDYYVNVIDSDSFRVALTRADAIAGTNLLVLTGAGVGTHTFHFAYFKGDVVWGGSLTLLASTSSRAFWCAVDLTTALPTVADWHQMPADGTFEMLHGVGTAALASLNYDQSFDEWGFTSKDGRPLTNLIREIAAAPSGSHATSDFTRFLFRGIQTAPTLAAPVLSLSTRNFGERYSISIPASPSFTFSAGGTTNHGLLPGDVVYVEDVGFTGAAMTGVAGTPGFFLVTTVTTPADNTFKLRTLAGGAEVGNGTGAPQAGGLRVVGSSTRLTETYVVTALNADNNESAASNELTVTNPLGVPGSSNTLTWTAVAGATRYRLYKKIDEAFGLIGETSALAFTDDNIGPDLEFQPPVYDNALESQFPAAIASFQQRGWFGGTDANERGVWGSKLGTRATMTHHERTPLATDRIQFSAAARERTLVRHIVPAAHLWLLTSAGEIRVTGVNNDVLAPGEIDARPVSQVGCTDVRPIVANSNILFVGESDQHVYELPSQVNQAIDPPDLSVRAHLLFDGYTIVQSAQQRSPVPIEWYLRSDGVLLGLTYMPQQNIRAWHVHTAGGTDAAIESICVVPESDGDRLYAIIARTIDGGTVRYVERMGRIETPATLTACKYLDSCVTYSGAAATTIGDLGHLEGETVYAMADGRVVGPLVVTGGAIRLPKAASTVHVGLRYEVELRTLPVTLLVEGFGKGIELNVSDVAVRVDRSCAFQVARYSDTDAEFGVTPRVGQAAGLVNDAMRTKDVAVPTVGGWDRNAQIVITQELPLPLTIVSLTLGVEAGGPR